MGKVSNHCYAVMDIVRSAHNQDVQNGKYLQGTSYTLAGNAHQLIPCVSVVVLGFFSPDDQVKREHYCFSPQESRLNFWEGDDEEVLGYIIKHFSQPGDMMLDLTGFKGK